MLSTPEPNISGVPLPPASTWLQFPIIAVIVLVMALAAIAIFAFTRWVWSEYKRERNTDRTWREEQNVKREAAVAEQNRLWREAMIERDQRWEKADQEKQGTLAEIAKATAIMISKLEDHDDQAKDIKKTVEAIYDKIPKRTR